MANKEKRDFTPKHFALLYFGALIVLLTFIGIMAWQGYSIINMATEYLLFGVLIVSALVAGAVLMIRRMLHKVARIAAGVLGGVVIIIVAVVMLVFFTVMLDLKAPAQYTVLTSPAGKNVVVMREWGSDPDLVDIRAAERWAEDPEAIEGEFTMDDLGHSYFAAPKVLGLFYDTNKKSEGYLEIGVNSEAELMYKWDGEKLTMYIENAEGGDAGEITLNME